MKGVKLTILNEGGGTTKPSSGSYYLEKDSRIYISALPDPGWNFKGWTGDLSGHDSTRLITMNTDKNVTAGFHKIIHTLAVKVNGRGTVKLTPRTKLYEHGSLIRIKAVPDDGWKFKGWSGDISGSNPAQAFVMNSDKSITAVFLPVHTLVVSVAGNGTTTPRPGTYRFEQGTRIYVSALAESGSRFNQWTGDISGRDSTRIITINSNKAVTADFQYQSAPVSIPATYIANLSSREIHLSDCLWVTKMKQTNKIPLRDYYDVVTMIKYHGYNGCYYCLSRYDRDTLAIETVIRNLETDLSNQ